MTPPPLEAYLTLTKLLGFKDTKMALGRRPHSFRTRWNTPQEGRSAMERGREKGIRLHKKVKTTKRKKSKDKLKPKTLSAKFKLK